MYATRDDIFDVLAPDDIRLKGHRIGVEDVLDLYHAGRNAQGIVEYYPTLELPLVKAVLAYYHDPAPSSTPTSPTSTHGRKNKPASPKNIPLPTHCECGRTWKSDAGERQQRLHE